ncbi:hypothetical protein ZWY2020_055691 [Hordeum vulgare]|nr:hypothetical protein ZWY2020_055691 [Hordeum vulgare]
MGPTAVTRTALRSAHRAAQTALLRPERPAVHVLKRHASEPGEVMHALTRVRREGADSETEPSKKAPPAPHRRGAASLLRRSCGTAVPQDSTRA